MKIVAAKLNDLQTDEFIHFLLLLFFNCFHSCVARQFASKVTCSIIVMSSVESDDKTSKMQIQKKKCSKIPFRLSKDKKCCCICFFVVVAYTDQSLFARSIITAVDDVCLKRNWLSEKKVVAYQIFFCCVVAFRSFQFFLNWMNNWHIKWLRQILISFWRLKIDSRRKGLKLTMKMFYFSSLNSWLSRWRRVRARAYCVYIQCFLFWIMIVQKDRPHCVLWFVYWLCGTVIPIDLLIKSLYSVWWFFIFFFSIHRALRS